jgi:hypothetical protein
MAVISLVKNLRNITIYFDLDLGNPSKFNLKGSNVTVITTQNPTYTTLLKTIVSLNENCFEMYNFVFDSTDRLDGSFTEFLEVLPKNHRYFFVTNNISVKPYNAYNWEQSEIMSYHDFYIIPPNSVSVFDMIRKEDGDIHMYNLNTKESYNIGDISQAIRNMKINEVLSNETET